MKHQTAMMATFVFSVILGINLFVFGNSKTDEALRALNRYKESQRWLEKFSMEMVVTYKEMSPGHKLETIRSSEVVVKKLGSLLSVSGVQQSHSRDVGPNPLIMKMVVNNKMGMSLGHEKDKQPTNASVTSNITKALDRDLTDLLFNGAILDGYVLMVDGKCLADLALESNDSAVIGKETIDGNPCLQIVSKTRYGKVELWLDEQNGCLPRKYAFKRSADDLCSGGKKLRECNFYGIGQGSSTGVFVKSDDTVLDQVEISKRGGYYFINKGRITGNASLSNWDTIRYEYIYNRTVFDPSPILSEDDFKINLPEGMLIVNEDDPNSGVVYEWRDGKVVPRFSDFFVSAEGKWHGRSLLLVLFWLVIGVVLMGVLLWRIRRNKKAGG